MHLIIIPFTIIVASTCEGHPAVAMSIAIDPLALVEGAVGPFVCTTTHYLVVREFTLVNVTFGHLVVANAMALIILPLSFIAASIWVPHFAVAFAFALDPITFVVSSIRPSCTSFAVK